MTDTPLESNSASLTNILEMVNNLPEYDAPEVSYDFFSLYNAEKVAEYSDTINIASDTSFDADSISEGVFTIIKNATEPSLEKSLTIDINNYIYLVSSEWYIIPEYTNNKPDTAYMIGRSGITASVYHDNGNVGISASKFKIVRWDGVEAYLNQSYGILWYSGGFSSLDNGILYLTHPQLAVRASSTMCSLDSLKAIDVSNTNLQIRQRIYRIPHNQYLNAMHDMCTTMINEGDFV